MRKIKVVLIHTTRLVLSDGYDGLKETINENEIGLVEVSGLRLVLSDDSNELFSETRPYEC